MASFDVLYLRPSDIARRLSVHRSQVYKMISSGTLAHVRMGKSVRVPTASFEAYVRSLEEKADQAVVSEQRHDSVGAEVESRLVAFKEMTGRDPFDFLEAWKRGEIEDTAEQAERAMDALALRAVLQREAAAV